MDEQYKIKDEMKKRKSKNEGRYLFFDFFQGFYLMARKGEIY